MKFAENLKELLKENSISQSRLARAIGFSQRAVSKWVNAQAEPTETAIVACAHFFGVSADELLGLDEKVPSTSLKESFLKEENELLKIYRKSSDFQKARILAYAEFLREHSDD